MKKSTSILVLVLLCTVNFFYAQNDDSLFKNDTTEIKIFNKKPYRLIQHYEKHNGNLISKFTYKKVDLPNVHFETSQAKLLHSYYKNLDFLARILNDNPTINLKIDGHTDKVGDSKKNLKLSIKRVNAIKLYLLKKGIKRERLITNGFGDTMPVCDPPCEKNQRVEFILEQGDVLPHFLSLVRKNNPEITEAEVKKIAQEMKERKLEWENSLKSEND